MRPVRVGIIGAGTIAGPYVAGLKEAPDFEVAAICSRAGTSARAFAADHGPMAVSFDEMLSDRSINYVLNLTPAHAHAAVTRSCLIAGKSVYSEKPLAGNLADADALIDLAAASELLLACAPATFLWSPLATARDLIASGTLGKPVGALTSLVYPGPELFHPNPQHLYGDGAGPLHDMGVYQITALVALLGPVVEVSAMSRRVRSRREVRTGPNAGRNFDVNCHTHVHALLRHANGAISSLIVSFDGVTARRPAFEIFGTEASLSISDFHRGDATVHIHRAGTNAEFAVGPCTVSPGEQWALGPISAWREWISGQNIQADARRARDVLGILVAIEAASHNDEVVKLVPSGCW